MTNSELNEKLDKLYPVNDVPGGYKYYTRYLLEKCVGMFTWKNCPPSLPSEQLELSLLVTGWAGIFYHPSYGLVTSAGGLSGVDLYYKPTDYTYSQPALGSGTKKIGDDCVVVYNNSTDYLFRRGLSETICRYARQLADIDASINILTVNSRATNGVVADNKQAADAVDTAQKAKELGSYQTINQNTILDSVKSFQLFNPQNISVSELLTARNAVLTSFMEELGVKTGAEKRERLLVDELQSQDQLLLVNVSDMLTSRQKGAEEINKIFGSDITVDLSDNFDIREMDAQEVKNDDNTKGMAE